MIDTKLAQRLDTEKGEISEALALIEGLDDVTQADLDRLQGIEDDARARGNAHEKLRLELTGPILDSKRLIDAKFKPIVEGYDKIKRAAARRLAAASKRIEAAREVALNKIAAAGGHVDQNTIMPAHHAPVIKGKADKLVLSIADLSLIPREYMGPDMVKLRYAAKAGITVPGLKVTVEKAGT